MLLKSLKDEKLSFKWVEDYSNKECSFLKAFIEDVTIEDILDNTCEPHNWSCSYSMVGDTKTCTISIGVGGRWVEKSGDSFAEAARKWGIGRSYYDKKTTITSILGEDDNWVPGHHIQPNGPVKNIPEGVLKKDSLQIEDLDGYVEFLSTKESNENK